MLISRTPFRISFVGGATDIQNYYSKFGGEVVSCAINKYIYVTYNKRDDKKIVISYTKLEIVDNINDIQHPIVKECCLIAGIEPGFEIHIISNISTIGTGLGGSSALTVGLLRVLFPDNSQKQIAEMACKLEIEYLGKCIGKQDQYACAIGGLNHFVFQKDGTVLNNSVFNNKIFDGSMYLVANEGAKDRAGTELILNRQGNNFSENLSNLHIIKRLCKPVISAIKTENPDRFRRLLGYYWIIKQKISPDNINPDTLNIVKKYVDLGCGVKICGAGQGGYLFIFDKEKKCDGIPVKIDYSGTVLIDNNKR